MDNQSSKKVKALPINRGIRETLRRRAAQTAESLRWNAGSLLLAGVALASTIVVGMTSEHMSLTAFVAVSGLFMLWFFSAWQAKKFEKEWFEEEMHIVAGMLSGHFDEDKREIACVTSETLLRSALSRRQLQILHEVALGKSNKEIACALGISQQTVKNHLGHIFKKLEVADRTLAVMIAIGNGWLETGTGKATSASMKKPGRAEVKSSDGYRIGG